MTDPAQHATAAAGSQRPEVTGDCDAPPPSVWTTAQRDARAQRAGRYPPAALAHPGKMLPGIAATAITRYTAAGELVAVQDDHPGGGGPAGAERELGDVSGGEHAVLVQHGQQPPVPGGEPAGDLGEQAGRDGQPARLCGFGHG